MRAVTAWVALAVIGVSLNAEGVCAALTQQQVDDANRIVDAASASPIWDRLAYMTDYYGPRPAGSTALEDAMDHVVGLARSDGLTVTTEPVPIQKAWTRGEEWIRMLSPRVKDLHMVGLGMSSSTPNKAPLTAEVMVVSDFAELEQRQAEVAGRIVLYNAPYTSYGRTVQYRVNGATRAEQYGAVATLVRSIAPYGMQTPHTGASVTAGIPAAAISIEDALQIQRMIDRGSNVTVQMLMSAQAMPDTQSRNIIIDLPGTEKPDEFVIVGGHFDSWDVAEGAIDDGGGAFIGWHALKLLTQLQLRPKRTIRAVMWVDEERGVEGGDRYAQMHADEFARTSIAIESDTGTFSPYRLGFSGVSDAYDALREFTPLLERLGSAEIAHGGGGEDIYPMCVTGVPCAGYETRDVRDSPYSTNPCLDFNTVNRTFDGVISDGYFWFHHTSADTIDKIAPEQLQNNAAAIAIWTYNIANMDELLPRENAARTEGEFSEKKSGRVLMWCIAAGFVLVLAGTLVMYCSRSKKDPYGRQVDEDELPVPRGGRI